jgi:ABC-2 type transport system ATP-binding protein
MIVVRGVEHGYAGITSLAISCPALDIGPGLTLLLGPNGAGKSTLLRLLAGVERPRAGTIAIDGHDLWREEVAARAALVYLPEHPDLTPYATVGEVLDLVERLRGEPVGAGAEALRVVGLDELASRSVRELSMGQRRRALLAAALVGEPRVALLDEPLENMDRTLRALILDWVARLVERGAAVAVATHELEPFAAPATRVVCIDAGAITSVCDVPTDAAERIALLERCATGG